MENWKILKKKNTTFNVSNLGRLQVLNKKSGKFEPANLSYSGGHSEARYLMTRGYYAHRLIAEAWIGSIPKDHEVNHIDGNKKNNKVTNLEIVTRSENIQHAFESGAHDSWMLSPREVDKRLLKKEINEIGKLWAVLNSDLRLVSQFNSQYEAACSIGVSRQTANNSFRLGKLIHKKYYICKRNKISELREKIIS